MTKNIYKKIFLFKIILLLFFLVRPALAAGAGNLSDAFKVDDKMVYAEKDRLDAAAFNMGYGIGRLGEQGGSTPEAIISIIIETVLSILGILFIALVIYGGILWMTAGGNDQQVEKAQNILKRAIIGLVIVLMAYAISVFVINIFINENQNEVQGLTPEQEQMIIDRYENSPSLKN